MLGFGTFTQQAVATNVRHVARLDTEAEAPCTVARALGYKAEDSTPSMVQLAQPGRPFATAYQELLPSYLDGGKFGGMSVILVHKTCTDGDIESSGYHVV